MGNGGWDKTNLKDFLYLLLGHAGWDSRCVVLLYSSRNLNTGHGGDSDRCCRGRMLYEEGGASQGSRIVAVLPKN